MTRFRADGGEKRFTRFRLLSRDFITSLRDSTFSLLTADLCTKNYQSEYIKVVCNMHVISRAASLSHFSHPM